MKRRQALTFAVTGALLGGVAIGGCGKDRGPTVNPGPSDLSPEPAVNPGPIDAEPSPEPEPEPDHVNEGPVVDPSTPEQPPLPTAKPPVMVNVVKQPEPEPVPDPVIEPSTNNVRKVEEPARKRR